MTNNNLPNLVKEARESLNITQQDIADELEVNRTTVSRWESGDIENMKLKYIPKLAEILQMPALAFIYPDTYLDSSDIDIEYIRAAKKLQDNRISSENIDLFIKTVNNIKKNLFIDLQ